MARITAIEPQKRSRDRVNIDLDGQFALGVASALGATLQLGQELDSTQIEALKSADAQETALAQALHFLSYRQRSEREVRTFLRGKGTPPEILEQTITRLLQKHFVDDAQFARAWVENRRTFRPRGRRALSWELVRKGIPAPIVEAATQEVDEDALAYAAGLKPASRLAPLAWQDFRRRLYAFLARRGFSAASIGSAITKLWAENHGGQNPTSENEDIP